MLSASRVAVRRFHASALNLKEAASAATTGKMAELTVNLALPHRALVDKREVKRVTIPSRDGALGVEKNAPALVAEMRPGVIRVDYMDNSIEEYFVPGGFAFKHANNSMDISAPEAAKLEAIDVEALRTQFKDATSKAAGASGKEAAQFKTMLEVYRILGQALKVQL